MLQVAIINSTNLTYIQNFTGEQVSAHLLLNVLLDSCFDVSVCLWTSENKLILRY